MGKFIEEFYYGNLDPQARSTKQNKAVQKQMEVLMLNEDYLTENLSGESKKKFLEFVNDYVYSVNHFVRACETLSSNKMEIFAGGKGLNQSIALARAGTNVVHGAKIGKDGDFLIDTLKSSGVNVDRIVKTTDSCGHAIIQVDNNGQNSILLYGGTNQCMNKEYVENFLSDATEKDILLLQNEVNGLDFIFKIAKEKGVQIAFNPSPINDNIKNLPLEQVAWWFVNEIEACELFGSNNPEEICNNFIEKYPHSNLILTLGKNGSIFVNSNTRIKQQIFDAKVVDTTAAGDTFTGYFISAILNNHTFDYALKLATKASSISVSRKGASASIPLLQEVVI